jgi:hypothetical protein
MSFLPEISGTVFTHPTETILLIEDITTGVLCGSFVRSSLQNIAGRGVNKAMNASATDDSHVALASLETETVTHRETVVVAMGVVNPFASGEKSLEGFIKVRCHD